MKKKGVRCVKRNFKDTDENTTMAARFWFREKNSENQKSSVHTSVCFAICLKWNLLLKQRFF